MVVPPPPDPDVGVGEGDEVVPLLVVGVGEGDVVPPVPGVGVGEGEGVPVNPKPGMTHPWVSEIEAASATNCAGTLLDRVIAAIPPGRQLLPVNRS